MSVVVKGKNDLLVFHCTIENHFDDVLKEIDELLDKPLFVEAGYYPKAFFDFGCRYLNEKELNCLLDVLLVKKRVIFCGVNLLKENEKIVDMYTKSIHAGEVVKIHRDTLFLMPLYEGGVIYSDSHVYFLGKVKGKVVGLSRDVRIYGHYFENAEIRIMNHCLHDVTTFTNVMIYDNKEEIVMKKEEDLWQESL